MKILPWVGWAWLLVIAAEGVYLAVDFFCGPWLYPLTVRPAPTSDRHTPENGDAATTLGLTIAPVIANSPFVAAVRQLGEDKPAITRIALFIAAAFVLAGAVIALSEANPALVASMLWVAWVVLVIACVAYGLAVLALAFRILWRRLRRRQSRPA